ncbi:hypothetical protein ABC382_01005 [Lysinibacillus sp. 1P01SD]|uniref:hypothetical protein n=1 Tax=Lysinibacillus sp. 1P01SD TaxID=3132285 RepID=UPI0039A08377
MQDTKKKEVGFFSVLLRIPTTLLKEIERIQITKGFSTRTSSFVFVLQTGIESLRRQEMELEAQRHEQERQTQPKKVTPIAWWEKELQDKEVQVQAK